MAVLGKVALRVKAYVTMLQVIMGNGVFYGCLSEPQGVSLLLNQL